jgi:hypothetical protein
MQRGYKYELWKGKKMVGLLLSTDKIVGHEFIVPEKIGNKIQKITLPISFRVISDDGVDVHYRRVLDVTKKSKRQINSLMGDE